MPDETPDRRGTPAHPPARRPGDEGLDRRDREGAGPRRAAAPRAGARRRIAGRAFPRAASVDGARARRGLVEAVTGATTERVRRALGM